MYEFGKQTRSESWFEKSVCKLMCEVCMSLVNKSEVGAGLRKKCASKLVCDLCMSLVNKPEVGAGLKKSVRVS